jgi:hypothetical protein
MIAMVKVDQVTEWAVSLRQSWVRLLVSPRIKTFLFTSFLNSF